MENRKNIVILGAGFGGLKITLILAKYLKSAGLEKKYRIILVDRNDYHTYTPMLYEIATTDKATADYAGLKSVAAFPIEAALRNFPVVFLKDEVESLDVAEKRCVFLRLNGRLDFDYLTLALGSETNYFNIPGLKEKSLSFKSLIDALRIRDHIWDAAKTEKRKELRVVVGGAGPAGVELAAEITCLACQMEESGALCNVKATIIEGGQGILPGFPPKVVEAAARRLKSLNVELATGNVIESVEDGAVILKNKRAVPFDILIWTGGTKAPTIAVSSGDSLKTDPRGRIEVMKELACLPTNPNLRVLKNVYAIGDIICFYDENNRPIPAVVKAAIKQAEVAAANVIAGIEAEESGLKTAEQRVYHPRAYPYIIPLGGKYAVAKVGPFILKGFFAWVAKGLVEFGYLCAILPKFQALKIWLKGMRIFVSNDRLG